MFEVRHYNNCKFKDRNGKSFFRAIVFYVDLRGRETPEKCLFVNKTLKAGNGGLSNTFYCTLENLITFSDNKSPT